MVGTERFDTDDEKWARNELTDFGSRERLYNREMEGECEEALEYMANELNQYLKKGKYADLLKSKYGVGVGFVDGNIELLHTK